MRAPTGLLGQELHRRTEPGDTNIAKGSCVVLVQHSSSVWDQQHPSDVCHVCSSSTFVTDGLGKEARTFVSLIHTGKKTKQSMCQY